MKNIIQLNKLAGLYALFFFIETELLVNGYRIKRVFGLEYKVTVLLIMIIFIIATFYFSFISSRNKIGKRYRFLSVVLWIPYYVLFIMVFAYLFPMTNKADEPGKGMGIILLGLFVIYPIYLGLLDLTGAYLWDYRKNKESKEESI